MAISRYMEGDNSINIARGLVLDTTYEHKFGAVASMSVATTGSIWDVDDTLYPWSAWDTAGVLTIPAVNASDNGATVTVVGLDANYDVITEDFVVSSSGTTTGTKTFKRAYRAFFTDGTTNVGNINIQRGGTTVVVIRAGQAQTLMAVYTVPEGHTAYMSKVSMSIEAGGDASGNMYSRIPTQTSFRIKHTFEIGDGGHYLYDFTVPLKFDARTDIDFRCSMRTNNSRASAAFDMILIKE